MTIAIFMGKAKPRNTAYGPAWSNVGGIISFRSDESMALLQLEKC